MQLSRRANKIMRLVRHRRRKALIILVVVFALVAAACGDDDDPVDQTTTTTAATTTTTAGPTTTPGPTTTTTVVSIEEAEGLAAVCEAGAAEGSFTYWATLEPDNFNRIRAPFLLRYPDIVIDFLNIREEDAAQRILTAISAGQDPEPDLIYGSQDGLFPIISRDLIDTTYDWGEVDVGPEMVHPTNMVRLFVVGLGIAYNVNNITPADLPATWEDLIDPQYANQVVVDPRGNPFDLLSIAWGEEQTLDYMTRFKDVVEPIIIRGGTAGMLEVAAGAAFMTTSGRADSNAEQQAAGAPLEMHYMDFVPIRVLYNGLIAGTNSPNAAACFAGWLATDEGKAAFETVEYKANEFPPEGVPASSTIVSVDSAEDAENANTVGALVADILAVG